MTFIVVWIGYWNDSFPLTVNVSDILPPETKNPKQQQLITQVFAVSPKLNAGVTMTDRKWIITRQIALMCCEDLSPFEVVQKRGFVKFLLKNNVIKHEDELADPTTVSRSGRHGH